MFVPGEQEAVVVAETLQLRDGQRTRVGEAGGFGAVAQVSAE